MHIMKMEKIMISRTEKLIISMIAILSFIALTYSTYADDIDCYDVTLNNTTGEYPTSGTYIANTVQYGGSIKYMCYIDWEENLPAGTNITIQLRSSDSTPLSGDFIGPDGTSSTYYTSPPSYINETHLDHQYIQWMANLTTTNTSVTPGLDNFRISCYTGCDINDSRECRNGYICAESGYCVLPGEEDLPIADNFNPENTTNFSAEPDIENVTNLTLGADEAAINFPENYSVNASGENYDMNIIFGDCFVAVNSAVLDITFNATAYLTMNNSDGHCGENIIFRSDHFRQSADAIRSELLICEECDEIQNTNGFITRFRVPHFSSYAIGPNSRLDIYDSAEGGSVNINEDIIFYANYTNKTSGEHIENATCLIEFDDNPGSWVPMTDNGDNYNYTKLSGFSTAGTHDWSVNCTHPSFYPLNTTDDIQVGEVGGEEVPEFSAATLLIAMVAVLAAIGLIRAKRE